MLFILLLPKINLKYEKCITQYRHEETYWDVRLVDVLLDINPYGLLSTQSTDLKLKYFRAPEDLAVYKSRLIFYQF